jgi:chromosome segregation ATPase
LALGSLITSALTFWAYGGRERIELLRSRLKRELEEARRQQRELGDALARRLHSGYEDTIARTRRAQARLDLLGKNASADMQPAIAAVAGRLSEIADESRAGLARLSREMSLELERAEEVLRERARRLEAHALILQARYEIGRAERLAEKGDVAAAQGELGEAARRVRQAQGRLGGDAAERQVLNDLLTALAQAGQLVHIKAEGARRHIEEIVASSHSLLAELEAREQSH